MSEPSTNQRILIVEDSPANISVLSELLKDYKLSVATSGEKALKIAHSSNAPDLILLDGRDPGGSRESV
ncbi:hypothetical protein UR09_01665 [Candidatus Nitromaritima sp. SCGC AAA799-A02]|nr:hypothetical protein UR09_01665 [Candidatus Nitromaritima sp. SCGC AAA799-A02]